MSCITRGKHIPTDVAVGDSNQQTKWGRHPATRRVMASPPVNQAPALRFVT
ncbi:MAG: hypothetical protein IKX18_06235 [Muribaculaceae bacterium]|nr:hypothetical protein [Muribaculaceae bacterium]